MTIERIDPQDRWSEAVIHNKTIYYTSVPEEKLDGDITEQMADTLAAIDIMLQRLGSDKSKIIDATIFLADKEDFAGMNAVWDAWVVAGSAPVRCTIEAKLMNPKYKVEIKIIAGI
ncbi:Enamine/imine deaminase [Photorhabdus australis subsp. thailandensis]|uniref:Enamine/imine deaminase n=1 Tax=Photorhabdus australis subsp. thailandensis TaxID=2805096 RepID=A0A1C0TYZ9_9GAMM|nr:RidA family protein [Photorhabdus australis]OCQ50897.1 Enamine/imine deaminase [Photorhabdus australis subsp. thailandensis]